VTDIELAILQDEQHREEAMLRDAVMMSEIDRMAPSRPWFLRPRGPPHLRPHLPRGPAFRGMRPRMRF